ncbi:MAG: glycoside hydrolase family 25 protein [Tissierellaceae bacterium]
MIIDISHHQEPNKIDYKKLCSQLKMAIIRVQYGSKLVDRYYREHIAQMKKYNIPFGVYAWVRGVDERDMEAEAVYFYNRSKELEPAFYALDVEEKSMANMRLGINAYVDKLRSLSREKIGVYIGHHVYKDFNLDLSKFDFIWIPRYGPNSGLIHNIKPVYPCDLWQYTDKGRLDGYGGYLDLNKLTGSRSLEFFVGVKEKQGDNEDTLSDWAEEAWKWAVEKKITDGTNPKGTVTREQLVTMLHRFYRSGNN